MDEVLSTLEKWPRYTNFISADWIQGTTFRRFRRYDMTQPLPDIIPVGTSIVFVGLTPNDTQIARKCDNCFRQHQPTNQNCSMTVHRPHSFLDNNMHLFNFKTQTKIPGTWKLIREETNHQSRMTLEEWKCISPI